MPGPHLFVGIHGSVGEEGMLFDLGHSLFTVGTAAAESELWISVYHLLGGQEGIHTDSVCCGTLVLE